MGGETLSKFVCYHTTLKERLNSILQNGLLPESKPAYFSSPAPYIMLSDKPWYDLHGNKSIVLAITDPAIHREYFDNPEGLRWPYPISPQYIEIFRKPVTEKFIQSILMQYVINWKQHVLALPNSTSVMSWEADLLSWTPARYIHEFEIKLNIHDYRADFKKKFKHMELLKPWKYPPGSNYIHRTPNYFWYVTVNFYIRPPKYAGWIYIETGDKILLYVQKKAPLLHKDKLPEKEDKRIMRILSWRLKNMYEIKHLREIGYDFREIPKKR